MCTQVYLYENDFIRLCVVISVGFQEKMFEKFACRKRGRGESQSTFQKDYRKTRFFWQFLQTPPEKSTVAKT